MKAGTVRFTPKGWAYFQMPQGLLILSPEEWRRGLQRGRRQRIATLIKPNGWIAHRNLLSATRYPAKDLEELCEELVKMGRIKTEPGQKGGKGWRWIST
jgi:hypothetical protein